MSGRVELTIGLFAAALGLIGLGFAVFGPATYTTAPTLSAGSISLWDQGIDTATVLIFLAAMLLGVLGVGVGAYLRSEGEGGDALALLWIGYALLLIGTGITLPGSTTAVVPSALHTSTPDSVGIGVYLLPATLAAFVAAIVGTAAHFEPRKTSLLRPR